MQPLTSSPFCLNVPEPQDVDILPQKIPQHLDTFCRAKALALWPSLLNRKNPRHCGSKTTKPQHIPIVTRTVALKGTLNRQARKLCLCNRPCWGLHCGDSLVPRSWLGLFGVFWVRVPKRVLEGLLEVRKFRRVPCTSQQADKPEMHCSLSWLKARLRINRLGSRFQHSMYNMHI